MFAGLLLALGIQSLLVFHAPEPEDLPWTPLDLRSPVGLFPARKLAAHAGAPRVGPAVLRRAAGGFGLVGVVLSVAAWL